MASSWPTKQGKKLAELKLTRMRARDAKFWTPPTIKTVAYADEEVIYLYIDG